MIYERLFIKFLTLFLKFSKTFKFDNLLLFMSKHIRKIYIVVDLLIIITSFSQGEDSSEFFPWVYNHSIKNLSTLQRFFLEPIL